ncbi:hypothetical protein V1525DRAFT_386272 [Lipomyces kononenkoae]|uniref:Uncharacterized protein n=1 Tax=Lipomyces kononenkoae TaxID=34357 RepID=A0ACC3T8D4_LIPKO
MSDVTEATPISSAAFSVGLDAHDARTATSKSSPPAYEGRPGTNRRVAIRRKGNLTSTALGISHLKHQVQISLSGEFGN